MISNLHTYSGLVGIITQGAFGEKEVCDLNDNYTNVYNYQIQSSCFKSSKK